MVEGLPTIKSSKGICKGCIVGKQPEHKFDRGKESRATCIFGMIHSDISSPIPKTSMNGSSYVLTFINDLYRFIIWVYFLQKKSKVLESSQILKLLLTMVLGERLRLSDKTMVVNTSNLICFKFVLKLESRFITPFPTHLSRMVQRKGKTGL